MSININLAGIVRESITDGPGIRFSIFCQGCTHKCEGCHNEQTWELNSGKDVSIIKLLEEIKKDRVLSGVTFTGGEPFLQAHAFYELGKMIKSETTLNIVAYTGYTYEELINKKDEDIEGLLSVVDYLIDGKFIIKKRDLTLSFRGSGNQRIIDMNKTRKNGKLTLANEYMI